MQLDSLSCQIVRCLLVTCPFSEPLGRTAQARPRAAGSQTCRTTFLGCVLVVC